MQRPAQARVPRAHDRPPTHMLLHSALVVCTVEGCGIKRKGLVLFHQALFAPPRHLWFLRKADYFILRLIGKRVCIPFIHIDWQYDGVSESKLTPGGPVFMVGCGSARIQHLLQAVQAQMGVRLRARLGEMRHWPSVVPPMALSVGSSCPSCLVCSS